MMLDAAALMLMPRYATPYAFTLLMLTMPLIMPPMLICAQHATAPLMLML